MFGISLISGWAGPGVRVIIAPSRRQVFSPPKAERQFWGFTSVKAKIHGFRMLFWVSAVWDVLGRRLWKNLKIPKKSKKSPEFYKDMAFFSCYACQDFPTTDGGGHAKQIYHCVRPYYTECPSSFFDNRLAGPPAKISASRFPWSGPSGCRPTPVVLFLHYAKIMQFRRTNMFYFSGFLRNCKICFEKT